MDKTEQRDRLAQHYLSAFYAFAITRIGSYCEAEELAQEIAYQCILAIEQNRVRENFDAFVWSVAHNTYKRWCSRKKPLSLDDGYDTYSNIAVDEPPMDEVFVQAEMTSRIRLDLSRMARQYRETLIGFYYDELPIREIAQRLAVSEEMVKFYLRAGKQKMKEAYTMNDVGEKSYKPSDFTIYKSAIDFSKINVWDIFKRKLPCQIALVCYDNARTISDISVETGTPAVYIEDEIQILIDAGLIVSQSKNKYRTNMHILKQNAIIQVKDQFKNLYDAYMPSILTAYDQYLPKLKECDVFKQAASENQWAWFFADNISDFDCDGHKLSAEDYPQILSDGSKAFIFAEEAVGSPWATGQTPTYLEKCIVWPRDIVIFGNHHFQKDLRDEHKAQALYDIYCGQGRETDVGLYAELLDQGYAVKVNGTMYCNVPVSTQKSRQVFDILNAELKIFLKPLCEEIRGNISRIVKLTIPEQLRHSARGFAETWIMFYAGTYLHEALNRRGFIALPADDSIIPIASYIYEK